MRGRTSTLTVLVLGVMAWLAAGTDEWRRAFPLAGRKNDYYNLLVHGFRHGHLSMEAKVDPRLLSPNPDIRATADYLLDASLYHGKYYLYYGVVPAVLLFLPYSELTGQDLPGNAAVLLMVALGFLFYLRIYLEARRRHFPGISGGSHAACILLLAFGSGTPALLINSGFYEIAIAGGYVCMAAAWFGLFRAWHSDRHSGRWLALASLAAGLAVGSRPTYVVFLPVLFIAAILLVRRAGRIPLPDAGRRARTGLFAAAVLPAGLVGLCLMAYNYARFDNPFEFGIHHEMDVAIMTGMPLARLSFIWPNLKWYFLRLPAFSPYFPYVFPMNAQVRPQDYYGYETIQGQMPALAMGLLCGVGLLGLRLRRRAFPPDLRLLSALVGGAFACLFLAEASFGFRANRYIPDFQGTFMLLLALAGGACAAFSGGRFGRGWRAVFGFLALAGASCNILTSLELSQRFQNTRPDSYRFLAYHGDYPSYLLAKWGLFHYGPVRFKVTFSPVAAVTTGPLIATGTPGYADVLYAVQYPGGLVQFNMEHGGYGGYGSGLIPVQPGRPYEMEVDMGSLYPPRIHPWFRDSGAKEVEKLKTTVRVLFDGEQVIRGRLGFYDAPPTSVHFGENPAGTGPPFSGKITDVRRLPPRDPRTLGLFDESGLWRLQFEAPSPVTLRNYPILASGVPGHGNLLLLEVLPGGKFRFGVDQWGGGLTSSPSFEALRPGLHRLEIFAGPQVALLKLPAGSGIDPAKVRASASTFRVWLDGVPVWTMAIAANRDSYDWVSIGSNPQGFSSAGTFYPTPIASQPYSPEEMIPFIAKNLAKN